MLARWWDGCVPFALVVRGGGRVGRDMVTWPRANPWDVALWVVLTRSACPVVGDSNLGFGRRAFEPLLGVVDHSGET